MQPAFLATGRLTTVRAALVVPSLITDRLGDPRYDQCLKIFTSRNTCQPRVDQHRFTLLAISRVPSALMQTREPRQ
jgi:hypothetical protein